MIIIITNQSVFLRKDWAEAMTVTSDLCVEVGREDTHLSYQLLKGRFKNFHSYISKHYMEAAAKTETFSVSLRRPCSCSKKLRAAGGLTSSRVQKYYCKNWC